MFGHNPRTRDLTHVGAAEMLAGLSQAAYCMVERYCPELLLDDIIARCYFSSLRVTFSKMLAPHTEASLELQMTLQPHGLPRFDFDGFIRGSVECGLASGEVGNGAPRRHAHLPLRVRETLRTFYNNGAELTLRSLSSTAPHRWSSHSLFSSDPRLRMCRYSTTTQLIIGLSQVAFAVVGEVNADNKNVLGWESRDFLDSMGDQALVKLSYDRPRGTQSALCLDTTLSSSKTLKGCKFIRLSLAGDLSGTMDSMLSPRVPVRTLKADAGFN